MKKKIIKITSLMTLCSVLLAGCGMTTNTDTEKSTAATNEGGVVNIYCWNDEFKGIYEKYAADIAKQHGVDVNFVIITSDNNAYQTNLDEALADQDEAIDDDKVDLFMIEADYAGKNVLFMLVMATMMIPGEATIISNYLTVSGWNWLDSYQVLIVPYLTSAMGIFLFRQFYMTFPISLYESAKLDGCSNLKFIVRILLPLTKSAIGAMAVYTFINAWNMYMWPLLVTGSNNMRTVQIGISMLDSVDSQSITLMIAGVVMIIIPSISIFIIGQKQLIRGMFSGAVKG